MNIFRRCPRPRYRLLERQSRRNTSAGIFRNSQRRRPAIQYLEPRRVLAATAVFEVNLFEDDNGVPGPEITNDTVFVDQTFFVQIAVQDIRDAGETSVGISSIGGNIFWDPLVFEEIDDPFNVNFDFNLLNFNFADLLHPNFVTFRDGILDNPAGRINALQGGIRVGQIQDAIGRDGPEQLSLFRFQAESPAAASPFVVEIGGGFADLAPFNTEFEAQVIHVISDATPLLSVADAGVVENDIGTQDLVFDVTLSELVPTQVSVDFATSDGTAVAQLVDGDYLQTNGSLTFEPGETTKQIVVPVSGDRLAEGTEEFTLTLNNLEDNNAPVGVEFDRDIATGTITDNDVSVISIKNGISINEDGDNIETELRFEIAITQPVDREVTVEFATSDGTALTADGDYQAASGRLTFLANDASSRFVSIFVTGDSKVELDEGFFLSLSNLQGGQGDVLLDTDPTSGEIVNDDMAEISINNVLIDEQDAGTQSLVFDVSLSSPIDVATTLGFSTVDDSAEDENGDGDYQSTSGDLTFEAGSTEIKTIEVTAVSDLFDEPDESFFVRLSNLQANGREVRFRNRQDAISGSGTLVNDDLPLISIDDVVMSEGDIGQTEFVFTLSLDKPQPHEITVEAHIDDGTATSTPGETDFFRPNLPDVVTFLPNSSTQQYTVLVSSDEIVEADEFFRVRLENAVGGSMSDDEGVGTILNDDSATISISDVIVDRENTSQAVFTVSLSNIVDAAVSFSYTTVNGTATDLDDFDFQSGQQILAPGETEKNITVPIHDDSVAEGSETFNVVLDGLDSSRDVAFAKSTASATIFDDDSATIAIDDVTMTELDGGQIEFTFTVTKTGLVDTNISFDFTTVGDTAQNEIGQGDFDSSSGTRTFLPGVANDVTSQLFIAVQVNGDLTVERSEVFHVELSNLQAAGRDVTITDNRGTGTIENDDAAEIGIGDVTIVEGDDGTSDAIFSVSLSSEVDAAISVDFATVNDTAQDEKGGGDFHSNSGSLTFPAGSTSEMIRVTVQGDDKFEADETFAVSLNNLVAGATPRDVVIGNGNAQGIIQNDDPLPTLSINDIQVTEPKNGTVDAIFTVTQTGVSDTEVMVEFATSDGTAQDENGNGDYQSVRGTLTFPADSVSGLQRTVSVPVHADAVSELSESFNVILSNSQGAAVADVTGVATIVDDPMNAELAGVVTYGGLDSGIGIPGVTISLRKAGESTPTATTVTDANGAYSFTGLTTDVWEIVEQDLSRVLVDGQDRIGTQGGDDSQNDQFRNIELSAGQTGAQNNFSELLLTPEFVSKRNFLTSSPDIGQIIAAAIAEVVAPVVETVTVEDSPVRSTPRPVAPEGEDRSANSAGSAMPAVTIVGGSAYLAGTVERGEIAVETGTTMHKITANNQTYSISADEVSFLRVEGGGGDGTLNFVSNVSSNRVELGPLATTPTDFGLMFSVDVQGVENITEHGNGDADEAVLIDSPDSDLLAAEAAAVILRGENFVNQVVDFEFVRAVSALGDIDMVDAGNAADAALRLEGDWLEEALAG